MIPIQTSTVFKPIRLFRNNTCRVAAIFIFVVLPLAGWASPALGQSEASQAAASESSRTPLPAAESSSSLSLGDTGVWVERYEKLAQGISEGSLDHRGADKFYKEFTGFLRKIYNEKRDSLIAAASNQSPRETAKAEKSSSETTVPAKNPQKTQEKPTAGSKTESLEARLHIVKQLLSDLSGLYRLRIQVLKLVSPELQAQLTGTGIEGVQAFQGELAYLNLMFRLRLHTFPQIARQSANNMLIAPLPAFFVLIQLCLSWLVYFWWRHWAFKTIPAARRKILDTRPRGAIHKFLAKLLWYLNRLRSPFEFGLLLLVWLKILDISQGQLLHSLLWGKVKWILMAWFLVALVDAIYTRGAAGMRTRIAKLRWRSIWLLAAWLLMVGLGLGIIADVAGKGTIHAWGWNAMKIAALPLLFLMIHWWRPEIFQKLEKESRLPAIIQRILHHQKGLRGYLGAVLGAVYLMVNGFRQWALKGITAFEGGRYFIAHLIRIEAMRVNERQREKRPGESISEEIRHRLFEWGGEIIESVGQESLKRMVRLAELKHRGVAAIIAERGGGKTKLLERLGSALDGQMIITDCPPGGFDAFQKVFAGTLGLAASDLTPEIVSARLQEDRIKAVGIDNIHRLSRPAFRGQQHLDQMAALLRGIETNVTWFFGIDRAAWHYISSIRSSQLFLDDTMRLPPWTETQIMELIDQQSHQAGITPDFGELTLPGQFEDIQFDTEEERNRFGYFRILWNASDGNPMVALVLWADSLRVAPDGRIVVYLPVLPETSELEKANITLLLTLRVIAQSEWANQDEIIDSLRFTVPEVTGALRMATDREWIERVEDRYRLSWKWFRSITQILTRKNLLVRRDQVV